MSDDNDDETLDIPVMGNWDAGRLPPPPGREHESDPQYTDQQLREQLLSSYDESVMWRRLYPPAHDQKSTSYFGGQPLMAQGVEWPRSFDGRCSLMFVGQIDLSTVPDFSQRSLLPETGILYFFFGATDDTPFGQLGRVIADFSELPLNTRERPDDVMPMWEGCAPSECDWLTNDQIRSFKYYREFPRYDVEPVLCRFFRDHHPTHYWGETGRRYQEMWKREQSREIIKAFGKPHSRWWPTGPDYYRRGAQKVLEPNVITGGKQPSPEEFGILPRINFEPWLPDEHWPYSWLFVEIAVSLMVKGVSTYSLDKAIRDDPENHDYYKEQIERYRKNRAAAESWLLRISDENRFKQLPAANHSEFRSWVLSIGQEELYLDPEVKAKKAAHLLESKTWHAGGAKPGAMPQRPHYRGGHDAFWQNSINKSVAISFMRGTELCLVEDSNAASLIPQGAVKFFQWRHEPLNDHGRSFVRHQLLGVPRIMQPTGMQLAQTHMLLMQFDTDLPIHWLWGDMGVLHYWIKREDLLQGQFENVVVTIDG